jgi:hypothetical protein
MTVDPDVMEARRPYAYTGDDPVNDRDPRGLRDEGTVGPILPKTSTGRPSLMRSRLMRLETSDPVARRSAALTFASKVVNGVPAWVSTRHLSSFAPQEVGVPVVVVLASARAR